MPLHEFENKHHHRQGGRQKHIVLARHVLNCMQGWGQELHSPKLSLCSCLCTLRCYLNVSTKAVNLDPCLFRNARIKSGPPKCNKHCSALSKPSTLGAGPSSLCNNFASCCPPCILGSFVSQITTWPSKHETHKSRSKGLEPCERCRSIISCCLTWCSIRRPHRPSAEGYSIFQTLAS